MPMLQRFKDAAFGLGITLVPIVALACVQFLLAPYTAATVYDLDPTTAPRAASSLRHGIVRPYTVIALIIAAYWLLAAALGRGQVLRIRSANIVLALSILTFALAVVIVSTVSMPWRLFKGACPVLGLSDEMPPQGIDGWYYFDGQSSCEAFARGAEPIVLLGLPLILLIASAILRIVVSRRR
jgi:hypothetical protein